MWSNNLTINKISTVEKFTTFDTRVFQTHSHTMGLFGMCASASSDVTNICEIDVINIAASTFVCILLICGIIYLYASKKQR